MVGRRNPIRPRPKTRPAPPRLRPHPEYRRPLRNRAGSGVRPAAAGVAAGAATTRMTPTGMTATRMATSAPAPPKAARLEATAVVTRAPAHHLWGMSAHDCPHPPPHTRAGSGDQTAGRADGQAVSWNERKSHPPSDLTSSTSLGTTGRSRHPNSRNEDGRAGDSGPAMGALAVGAVVIGG
jgi:hypothetical protein